MATLKYKLSNIAYTAIFKSHSVRLFYIETNFSDVSKINFTDVTTQYILNKSTFASFILVF